MRTLASIVEGHGEVLTLPPLLRRIAQDLASGSPLSAPTPWRLPRGRFRIAGELERAVAVVSRRVIGEGGVIILLDSDKECPVALAAELGQRAAGAVAPGCPVSVVAVAMDLTQARACRSFRKLDKEVRILLGGG